MMHCAEMDTTEFVMDSSSSSKQYRVRAFLPSGDPPTCDCVAFAISRNRDGGRNHGGKGHCKHIQKVMDETCQWQETPGDPSKISGVCPRCGGPATASVPMEIPENPKEAEKVVADKLLALAASLTDHGVTEDG